MQLDGVGSDHGSRAHQVTNCMHEHTHYHKTGNAAASAANSRTAQMQEKQQQQQAQFSLSDWLQKLLGRGKGLFKGIWGTNSLPADGTPAGHTGQEQVMAQLGESAANAGRGAVPAESRVPYANPYFQEIRSDRPAVHMTPFQRVRERVSSVTGQLAGKLAGHFSRFQAKNSFQAKSEQKPGEDLRKRSKYKKDEVEIDCVLTDESYLLDSYDRKGEYRRLTTKE